MTHQSSNYWNEVPMKKRKPRSRDLPKDRKNKEATIQKKRRQEEKNGRYNDAEELI